MVKQETLEAIKDIHGRLTKRHGIHSITARMIRHEMEDYKSEPRDAFKQFRRKLYKKYIKKVHQDALEFETKGQKDNYK